MCNVCVYIYMYVCVCIYIYIYILGWPKSPFSFFSKIKDTFFIFTNNFID